MEVSPLILLFCLLNIKRTPYYLLYIVFYNPLGFFLFLLKEFSVAGRATYVAGRATYVARPATEITLKGKNIFP